MNLWKGLLSLLTSASGEMTEMRDAKRAKDAGRDRKRGFSQTRGKFTWRCSIPMGTVRANTKSEARARFKAIIVAGEALSFNPVPITRLPLGAKVMRA